MPKQRTMKIYIKNMVCERCKLIIKNLLNDFNLKPVSVALGEVELGEKTLSLAQIQLIKEGIEPFGFELIDDRKSRIIESIKNLIIELVHQTDEFTKIKISDYLRDNLHYDYNYLSNLFSSVEAVTIEQFLINQRIEKAKELLLYDELNLTEISHRLGYSSLAHLSRQFKKVTGLTPSHFKRLKDAHGRRSLDKV